MTIPHIHKDVIIAWANGEIIERYNSHIGEWELWKDDFSPTWNPIHKYRIYKEPKWHDNIPEQGILCKVWDFDEDEVSYLILVREYFDERFVDDIGNTWNYAEPLTLDDVKHYIYSGE